MMDDSYKVINTNIIVTIIKTVVCILYSISCRNKNPGIKNKQLFLSLKNNYIK